MTQNCFRYQKKISTYDKQQWEKTVEQRILSGFIHVPLKNTKLKTELIDVDLVRGIEQQNIWFANLVYSFYLFLIDTGSSFPKAKPKQTLLTVLRLAVLRLFLLPVYAKWWVEQTSPKIFIFLLALYVLQLFNWSIYSYNIHRTDYDAEVVSDAIFSVIYLLIDAFSFVDFPAHCIDNRSGNTECIELTAIFDPFTNRSNGLH